MSACFMRLIAALCLLAACRTSAATLYVDLNSPGPLAPYSSWATAATNIQDAVDASSPGDLVLVTNGVYASGGRTAPASILTNRVMVFRAITLQSVNGPLATVIQGYQVPGTHYGDNAVRCVYLGDRSSLIGFTLNNGATRTNGDPDYDQSGGGVFCAQTFDVLVSNCVVSQNFSLVNSNIEGSGGAVCSGTLVDCVVISNTGGGAVNCNLSNCTLSSNVGSGAARCTLNNCVITGNHGATFGGGAYVSTLNNCLIVGNSSISAGTAIWGGGPPQHRPVASNCLIINNSPAPDNGAGATVFDVLLNNCMVINNVGSVLTGGTLGGSNNNCIVCFNTSGSTGNLTNDNYSGSGFSYSCTMPLPTKGIGNITNDPLFIDLANGNFRLQSNSPCINAGNNLYAPADPDLDGNPRIVGGTVDIGAYEFQNPTSQLSYAWLQQYNLPTDGSADLTDTDSDGMNNYQEWRAGTDPTNPNSKLLLLNPTNSGTNLVVTWQSVTNHNYYLQRSLGLMPPSFQLLATNLPGQSGTTSYTDTNAPAPGPWFYRVGVQ